MVSFSIGAFSNVVIEGLYVFGNKHGGALDRLSHATVSVSVKNQTLVT